MGTPKEELGHNWFGGDYETQHRVTLTKPFYIGVFEVTQKQYELVAGDTPSEFKGDTRPVESVSYETLRGTANGAAWPAHNRVDANTFFGILRKKTGQAFDLPTEAQWEYACRAGTSTALNTGENLSDTEKCAEMSKAGRYSYNREDGRGGYNTAHTKVGSYQPNAWGLYDMHGNVAEWCLDWWQNSLGTDAVSDPLGAANGSYRLVRGGCWFDYEYAGYAAVCRSGSRCYYYDFSARPGYSLNFWGFRVSCPCP